MCFRAQTLQITNQAEFALEFAKVCGRQGSILVGLTNSYCTQVGAKALKKPEAVISTIVSFNNSLTFGGTLDPTFSLTVVRVLVTIITHFGE